MTTGLGIAPTAAGVGTDSLTLRKIQDALIDAGVITGLGVTATTGLTYQVAEGVAALTRGSADGVVLAYTPAVTVTAGAGPASGSRIDSVWIRQHDPNQGDADNLVEVGITAGTAATTPTAPALPTGALELARYLVPSGATSTSAGTSQGSVDYAIPYGGSLGTLYDNTNTFDGPGDITTKWYTEQLGQVTLPTDREVTLELSACISTTTQTDTAAGGWYAAFQVDGVDVVGSEFHLTRTHQTLYFSHTMTLSAGTHTVAIHNHMTWGDPPTYHYSASGDEAAHYVGRRFRVFDRGVAQ